MIEKSSGTIVESTESMPAREESAISDTAIIQNEPVEENESITPEDSPSNQQPKNSFPAKGEGGCILAAGENVAAPDGAETIALSDEPNADRRH